MAGIGFELRKIFKNNTLISVFKGFTSATFIASGPMLVSILLLIVIDKLLKTANIPMIDRETIKAAILYAYVFSMIISSGFNMMISRYISDKIYINEKKHILSSLIGIISIVLAIGFIFSAFYLIKSPLPILQKFFFYIIFVELTILYIIMAYISAIKNYKKVVLSFILGSVITIILTIILLNYGVNAVNGTLFSVSIGYFVNIVILLMALVEYFGFLSNDIFAFLPYFKQHYKLFLINFFYTTGIFIHNIIFWKFSNLSISVKDTFIYAPSYDTASFFAVLTTIPAAIIFVVKFETTFYEKYRRFCDVIVEGGSLRDLINSKKIMIDTLKRELTFLIEIQLIITIVFTIIGVYVVLPTFANDIQAIELYPFLSIGFFMSYLSFLIIIVLIYFDIQFESLIISVTFFLLTIVFSIISISLGENFYGIGYDLSSMITFILSLYFLNKEMDLIDYRLYSK